MAVVVDRITNETQSYVPEGGQSVTPGLLPFVMGLFFVWGGITSLNDVIIPKLKDLFSLSYAEALTVQSAFFAAYLLVSYPAALVLRRIGYIRTAVVGLLTMTAGCLLFIPASLTAVFPLFLFALFVLAAGITIVQVVANPLVTQLGPSRSAHSRLTLAQAFNSVGTTIFPYLGALLILGSVSGASTVAPGSSALDAHRISETQVIIHAYLALATVLAVIAAAVWLQRDRVVTFQSASVTAGTGKGALNLFRNRRVALGTACIFLYVGAEVTIGSLIVNYLMLPDKMALPERAAGTHIAYYWGGALVGRFAGAALLRFIAPGRMLAASSLGAITLIVISVATTGPVSGWLLLAVGLMNAIMFPTIFSLATEGLGERTPQASGLLCMAIVGGAIVPPLTGMLADHWTLSLALLLPASCYLLITMFGILSRNRLED